MKVFGASQAAAERDLMAVASLESVELLARWPQIIDSGHSPNVSSSGLLQIEVIIGGGVQKGGAVGMPLLAGVSVSKDGEQSSILKENYTVADENEPCDMFDFLPRRVYVPLISARSAPNATRLGRGCYIEARVLMPRALIVRQLRDAAQFVA